MTELQLNFIKIPASEFTMGSKRSLDRDAHDDEMPAHALNVSDYFIMKYPVTNAQYNQFIQATGYRTPLLWPNGSYPANKADHPLIGPMPTPTASGRASACRPKRNGKRPPADLK